MKRFRRLLVGLNLTDQDNAVIQAAGKITHLFQSEKVYFMYIVERPDVPEEISEKYPDLLGPSEEDAGKMIHEKVDNFYKGAPVTNIAHEIVEGKQVDMLLQHIRQKDIDLVVVGRKRWENISGHVTEHLARKAPCSVLIIPEGNDMVLKNILVGTDFSPHSKEAMDTAIAFAFRTGLAKIACLHIIGYQSPDKYYDGFLGLLKKVAREDFDKFLDQFNFQGINVSSTIKVGHNTARAIRDFLRMHKIDLIVVGARGRSAAAAVLLGSVTENLIRITNIPLLAVKRKGENMNLLKAIFEN